MRISSKYKLLVDAGFIVFASILLILIEELDLKSKLYTFILIPIIFAYYLGQYVQRNMNHSEKNTGAK